MSWYLKAADRRRAELSAQYQLGVMYLKGQGVSKEAEAAYMWANLAAAARNDEAAKLRADIERTAAPGRIEEGKRMTREWVEKRLR
jgi:TPR repeat protein